MTQSFILVIFFIVTSGAFLVPDVRRWHQLPPNPMNQLANDLEANPEELMGELEDVRFLLWTRSNEGDLDHYRLFPEDILNLEGSPFNGSRPTFVLYHGFNDQGECGWIRESKTELLKLGDVNVISVDWQKLVISPWYNYAVENVYRVSNYTAGLLDWLHMQTGLQASQVHVVGHSLGAHTAGLTARRVTSGQVARVTGLDPAGPLFYDKPTDQRIDRSDAAFVDIIHVNSGPLIEGCIALFEPIGHVDFYPNGGMHQPGCTLVRSSPNAIRSDWMDLFEGCSHARATAYWVESIRAETSGEAFKGWPCSDWDTYFTGGCPDCGPGCLEMGYAVAHGLEGKYFLRTNPTSPYALGDVQ